MTDYVVTSATVSGGTISAGDTQTVIDAGITIDTTAFGLQTVSSGGIASATLDYDSQVVGAGGVAQATTVEYQASLYVLSGGMLDGANAGSGSYGAATIVVSSGGSATGVVVDNTSTLTVFEGGSVISSMIGYESVQTLSGAVATGTMVGTPSDNYFGSAMEIVVAGGLSEAPSIYDGIEIVSSGGTVSGAVVEFGDGVISVGAGGTSLAATVYGTLLVSSGGIDSGALLGSRTGYGTQAIEIVSGGGLTSAVTVGASATLSVSSGGAASGVLVQSAGVAFISSGGSVSGAEIMSGGALLLLPGANFTAVTPDPGGTVLSTGVAVLSGSLIESSPDTLSGLTTSSATVYVLTSGNLVNAASGTTVIVESGGSATGIGYYNEVIVSSGGVASGVGNTYYEFVAGTTFGDVDRAIEYYVESGGVASGATVIGQTLTVSSGGMTVNTLLQAAPPSLSAYAAGFIQSFETVLSGATEIGTIDSLDGIDEVFGVASGTVASAYGIEYIESGGMAFGALATGGEVYVGSAGTATSTTVLSGGREYVASSGVSLSATIYSGGEQSVVGLSTSATVSSGGFLIVSSGATADASHILSGATLVELPGAIVTGVVADPGSILLTGGVLLLSGVAVLTAASSTTGLQVASAETALLFNGGTATATLVSSGGLQTVSGGGIASGSLIYGTAVIASGGVAVGETVAIAAGTLASSLYPAGGTETISAGGVTTGTILSAYGTQIVLSGGIAYGDEIESGSIETVSSGGALSGGSIDSGAFLALSAGTATGLVINGGGVAAIESQYNPIDNAQYDGAIFGIDQSATVAAGGVEAVSNFGSSVSTTVLSGGLQIVSSGGSASSADIESGGVQLVLPNGSATSTLVQPGGLVYSTGVAVTQGASLVSYDPAILTGIAISGSTGVEYVLAGGTASATTIGNLAQATIYGGGMAVAATVLSGGTQTVGGGTTTGTVVSSGGTEIVAGGVASGSTIMSGATQQLIGRSYTSGTILSGGSEALGLDAASYGTIVGSGGTLSLDETNYIESTTIQSGGIVIDNGNDIDSLYTFLPNENVSTTIQSGGTYEFAGNATDTYYMSAAIGAVFYINDIFGATDTFDPATGQVHLQWIDDGADFDFQLVGDYSGDVLVAAQAYVPGQPNEYDGSTGVNFTLEVACYARGTMILTDRGEIAVENLAAGDGVVTASGAVRPVKWIGHRDVDCTRHPQPDLVCPVRIRAGAFGADLPRRDLLLSPDHAVFAGGVLIPVKHLVNGATVTTETPAAVTYYHVELDTHDAILAEGLPCETYLDNGSRTAFANGGGVMQLYPDFSPAAQCEAASEALGYAPLRIMGPQVDRVRSRLRRRAMKLGYKPVPAPRKRTAPRVQPPASPDLTALLQPAWYLAAHPDVLAAGIDPAVHYTRHGCQEGRLPCPEADLLRGLGLIDPATIIRTMPDVVAAGLDASEHFCTHGWREGRRPNAYFDTTWYCDTHGVPDGINPLVQYVLSGEAAGLMPSPHFDPAWYRRQYRLGGSVSALAHYLAYRRTGRFSPLPSFDVAAYRDRNAAALQTGRDPYAHYLAVGRFENPDERRPAA